MTDILSVIKEKKLKSIKKSMQYTDAVERKTQELVELTKVNINGSSLENENLRVLFRTYCQMCEEYTGKHSYAILGAMSKKDIAFWTRVETCREKAGVTPHVYLMAQFVWFDKTFGKHPTRVQLATEAAVDRAINYTNTGKTKVVRANKEVKSDFASLMRQAESQMQDIMRAQNCSREDVYRNFVLNGFITFPKEFLEADPTYAAIKLSP